MRIYTKKIPPTDEERRKAEEAKNGGAVAADEYEWKVQDSPFLYLTTELPPPPLFKDEHHENIIPQVREDNWKLKGHSGGLKSGLG